MCLRYGRRSRVVDSITREMGYTLKEFSQVLNAGFSDRASGLVCTATDRHSWEIQLVATEARLHLTIQQKPLRQLGSLEIPVLHVVFEFSGFTSEQKTALMDRFNRYFHKGGG